MQAHTQSKITKNALGQSTEGKRKKYFWKTEIFVMRNIGLFQSYKRENDRLIAQVTS